MLFLYAVIKFIAYTGHCFLGATLVPVGGYTGRDSPWKISLRLGSLRWLLGAVIGTFIFFAFPDIRQNVWSQYIGIYVPVRFFEWGVIAVLLFPTETAAPGRARALRWLAWIVLGIVVSYAADLASPEMLKTGRLCSGRCFC
jgi:hypothetical protein